MCHFYVRLLIDPAWFFSNVFPWSCTYFIASFHSNPLRYGIILLLFLGQEALDPESLVRSHGEERTQQHIGWWRRKKTPRNTSSFCFLLQRFKKYGYYFQIYAILTSRRSNLLCSPPLPLKSLCTLFVISQYNKATGFCICLIPIPICYFLSSMKAETIFYCW